MSILFKEQIWVLPAGIGRVGEWDTETREHIHNLRDFNPEIKHWGDLAIGFAFGSYSEDILGVSCNGPQSKTKVEYRIKPDNSFARRNTRAEETIVNLVKFVYYFDGYKKKHGW